MSVCMHSAVSLADRNVCAITTPLSIMASMSACVSVCLSANISPELHVQKSSPSLLCMLKCFQTSDTSSDMLYDVSLDLTRGRRGSVLLSRRCAISDVFPVLWTTSSVHILDHKETCRYCCSERHCVVVRRITPLLRRIDCVAC